MEFEIGQPVVVKKSKRTYIHTPEGSWGHIVDINKSTKQVEIEFCHIASKRRARRGEDEHQVRVVYITDIEVYKGSPGLQKAQEQKETVEEKKETKEIAKKAEELTGRVVDKLVIKDGVVQHTRQTIKQVLPLADFIKSLAPNKQYIVTTPLLAPNTAFYFEDRAASKQIFVTENNPGAHSLKFAHEGEEAKSALVSLPWLYFVWYFTKKALTKVEIYARCTMIDQETDELFRPFFNAETFAAAHENKAGHVETIESNTERFFEAALEFKASEKVSSLEEWEEKTREDDLFVLEAGLAEQDKCDQTIATLVETFMG